ncbi:MAG: hypothetical protein AB1767_04180 [Bacillota bacterium]
MERHDITYTVKDQVGLITLNRPAVLNAVRRETWAELSAVMREVKEDAQVRCLVHGSRDLHQHRVNTNLPGLRSPGHGLVLLP